MTREEKKVAEQRLWELERVHIERQEQMRLETENRAQVSHHYRNFFLGHLQTCISWHS